jgi:thiol-disulfide isomerase/thioredoxin
MCKKFMQSAGVVLLCTFAALHAEDRPEGPTNEKAKKSYSEGVEYLHQHNIGYALESFKKADKQDDYHCKACQKNIIQYALEIGDWKSAETAAAEMVAAAQGDTNIALTHYQYGSILLQEARSKHKNDVFIHAHEEFSKAITTVAKFPDAIIADGLVLAELKQDEDAKARFEQFVKFKPADDPDRLRVERYIAQPDLARARLAPPFAVTTNDGQHISLDDLKGKVVLIDFWATWCAPCRAALPHIKGIANKFQGQPLVILSVSLDDNEQKWKDFIAKNAMIWPQYYDGGFRGTIARKFGVEAIPQTFTIDAEGTLQDVHIDDDVYLEGKLKKLLAKAQELQASGKKSQ